MFVQDTLNKCFTPVVENNTTILHMMGVGVGVGMKEAKQLMTLLAS